MIKGSTMGLTFIYFTKMVKDLGPTALADFLTTVGVQGADLAVRPGYPVEPTNIDQKLGALVKLFKDRGLSIPLISAATNLIDANSDEAKRLFGAAGQHGVGAIKIGYFRYQNAFDDALSEARRRLTDFAKLAEKTGVKACYHTHSGTYIGSNGAGQRLLLEGFDPHHVGAFIDTGHQAVGGEPFHQAADCVRQWWSHLAIKDIVWVKDPRGWRHEVAPASQGIVNWKDVGKTIADLRFNGPVSLHGEYETTDLAQRIEWGKQEVAYLTSTLQSKPR